MTPLQKVVLSLIGAVAALGWLIAIATIAFTAWAVVVGEHVSVYK